MQLLKVKELADAGVNGKFCCCSHVETTIMYTFTMAGNKRPLLDRSPGWEPVLPKISIRLCLKVGQLGGAGCLICLYKPLPELLGGGNLALLLGAEHPRTTACQV